MTFTVDHARVDQFGSAFDALGKDAHAALNYIIANEKTVGDGAPMFRTVAATAAEAWHALYLGLQSLEKISTASGKELHATATLYHKTDHANAARVDATYKPAGTDGGLDEAVREGRSAKVTDPETQLVPPTAKDPIPSLADQMMNFPDFFSPTHWVGVAIELVCGTNPAQWAAEKYTGDWRHVAELASMWRHVGEFLETFAGDVRTEAGTALLSWQGNAASACERYMADFADVLDGKFAKATKGIAGQLDAVAYGVWATAKAIVGLLELLLDTIIEIAILQAAAAALIETGVGTVVMEGLAAAKVLQGIKTFLEIAKWHGVAMELCNAFTGLAAGYFGMLKSLSEQTLPGAYDHPGAR